MVYCNFPVWMCHTWCPQLYLVITSLYECSHSDNCTVPALFTESCATCTVPAVFTQSSATCTVDATCHRQITKLPVRLGARFTYSH